MLKKDEQGLKALVDDDTETLIIGTFPSEISRMTGEYYSNERKNNFWNTVAKKYNIKRFNDYEDKKNTLKEHKIGLWDILKSCDIEGSKNKTITNEKYNDINGLLAKYTKIKKIIINGISKNKSTLYFVEEYQKKYGRINVLTVKLPMQAGKYYGINKEIIDKMWLEALPE